MQQTNTSNNNSSKIILSALVVARNEELNLNECLEKLKHADEIVVVLDRTTDSSEKIAKNLGAKVIKGSWPLEGDRRNTGLKNCSGDWILEVDADEIVSKELFQEIRSKISNSEKGYYLVPFENYIGDKLIKYGWGASWGVTASPRLSYKGMKTWGMQRIHPKLELQGKKLWLENPIAHKLDKNISDMILRLDKYSKAKAADIRDNREKIPSNWITVRRGITRFYKCYVSRKGYKEGGWGFIIAFMAAAYIILSYLRANLEDKNDQPNKKI